MPQYWKRHICVGCGSAYRYPFGGPRKTSPRGGNTPDMRPCPTCGLYQPDMIGTRRMMLHGLIGILGALGGGAVVVLGITKEFSDRQVIAAAAGIGAVVFLAQLGVVLWDPNRNQERNQQCARTLLKSDDLQLLHGENPAKAATKLPNWGASRSHIVALIGLLLAGLFFVSGELVRHVLGWPINPECRPGVLGPGDESRFFFESHKSVDRKWYGQVTVEVANASELGLADTRVSATTKQDSWGHIIYVKSDSEDAFFRPWVDVHIPESAKLAGKKIELNVKLLMTAPVLHGDHYENEQSTLTTKVSIQLADRPGAGKLYAYILFGGGFLEALGLLAMSLVLVASAVALRRTASPMRLVHDGDEDDDYDDFDDYPRRRRRRRRLDDLD